MSRPHDRDRRAAGEPREWTDNDPLAAHAETYIELKSDEDKRRRATNARPASSTP